MKNAEYFLALVALGSVLAFGSVEATAFTAMEIGVAGLALLAFWTRGWPALSPPVTMVLGFVLLVPVAQSLALPRGLTALVSPARVTLQEELLSPWNLAAATVPITINRYATWLAASKLICYALVFLMAFQVFKQRGQSLLVPVMMGMGLFEAAYGLIQYLAEWPYIFSYRNAYGTGAATGTYINRNHYAGLLEMVLPFILAGIWFRLPRLPSPFL